MDEKKKQMEADWMVSEGQDRVRGKIKKMQARANAANLLSDYKLEPYVNKEEEIEEEWHKHEVSQNKKRIQDIRLTAQQIDTFMKDHGRK